MDHPSNGSSPLKCNESLADFFFNGSVLSSSPERKTNFSVDWNKEYESLYDVPAGLVVLLSCFYGSISILAVVGNSLVMWIVATSRRMQNVTNCFIANLALADIVIGLFAIPFQFQAALLQRWNLPHFMCAFCPFVQVLSVNVSVFTLTAIAVDRHRAILDPLSARPSKKFAKIVIAGIWLLALVIAIPMAMALRVDMVEEIDFVTLLPHTKPFCYPYNMSEKSMMIYRMVLFFLQYLTPLCVISFVYARMALRLWGTKAPGNAQDSRDATLMKNKKKVIKMLVIVVALFGICWLPLQTYQVLQTCLPFINEYRYINIIFFCFDWLAMSNSCYNPFIYGIYNVISVHVADNSEKFRREFRQRFPCCQRRMRRGGTLGTESFDVDKNTSIHHTRHSSVRSVYTWRRSARAASSAHNSSSSRSTTLSVVEPQGLRKKVSIRGDPFDRNSGSGSRSNNTFALNPDRASREASFARKASESNGAAHSEDEESRSCILNKCAEKYVTELYVFPHRECIHSRNRVETEDVAV